MNDDYRMGFRDGYREGYRAGQATRLAMDRGKRADALDLNIEARKQTKRKSSKKSKK